MLSPDWLTTGIKVHVPIFRDCGKVLSAAQLHSEIQFKVPVCAEGWLVLTRQNVTVGYSHMCTYKVSE